MKLGGSVIGPWETAEDWQKLLKKTRFAAINCPVDSGTDRHKVREIIQATREMGVVIAEAGVWRNTLSNDRAERETAQNYALAQLAFCEEHDIPCCVNIAGCVGPKWDGAYRENYSQKGYEELVASVQSIIDSVNPKRAFYTLEPMPWMLPDGPDEYLQLMKDINRKQFAVHLDFVNMLNSPRRFLYAEEFIEECLIKLGPYIKSTHIKDIRMSDKLTTQLYEDAPGKGQLDWTVVLKSLDRHLKGDAPVLLEHMETFEQFDAAFAFIEGIAEDLLIPIH